MFFKRFDGATKQSPLPPLREFHTIPWRDSWIIVIVREEGKNPINTIGCVVLSLWLNTKIRSLSNAAFHTSLLLLFRCQYFQTLFTQSLTVKQTQVRVRSKRVSVALANSKMFTVIWTRNHPFPCPLSHGWEDNHLPWKDHFDEFTKLLQMQESLKKLLFRNLLFPSNLFCLKPLLVW